VKLVNKFTLVLISSIIFFFQANGYILSLTQNEIRNIAEKVTLNIATIGTDFEINPIGSGVLILQDNNVYYMLTNNHILLNSENVNYYVFISDGRFCKIKVLQKHETLDLAEVNFSSNDCIGNDNKDQSGYKIMVRAGSSYNLRKNNSVYVAGWPIPDSNERRNLKFTYGQVTNTSATKNPLTYTNQIENGMSGGPVFNQEGQLVGINFSRLGEDIQGGKAIPVETIKATVITEPIKAALSCENIMIWGCP
jgi:S1-C subfamily serine protease